MQSIYLTQEEQAALIDLLEACIEDMREEIAHTDRLDYKDHLRQRKLVLMRLLDRLRQPQEAMGL